MFVTTSKLLGIPALRADHQAGAQRARQGETGRNEHCNPKAPHEGLVQDLLEHPPLLSLDLWRYLRLGKLRHLRIQGAPNSGRNLQFGQARVERRSE